jgi:hypothetical protein
MALKWLTVEEMNQVPGPWVTEGNAARTAIEKIPGYWQRSCLGRGKL